MRKNKWRKNRGTTGAHEAAVFKGPRKMGSKKNIPRKTPKPSKKLSQWEISFGDP